jgi:preprotein translocase subunit SecA
MVTNAIEKAQRKVEGRNFDYRKQILEYDDVANDQRRVIYAQRNDLLEMDNINEAIAGIREEVVYNFIADYIPPQSVEEQWDISGLEKYMESEFGVKIPVQAWLDADDGLYEETLKEKILGEMDKVYEEKSKQFGPMLNTVEKQLFLQVLDQLWKEHLQNMDSMRQGIGLRAYAQKNPKQEYKRESFALFEKLLDTLKHDITRVLFRIQPMTQEQIEEIEQRRREEAKRQQLKAHHEKVNTLATEEEMKDMTPDRPYVREGKKVGRNDECPCGSGKKYKSCHGKLN